MISRTLLFSGLALALAGCSTTASLSTDPLSSRWVGTEAGKFFAAYGPPAADEGGGSSTTYLWRGGYKTRTVPAQYSGSGKGRKLVSRARTEYLSCKVRLTVNASYSITAITPINDRPGLNGGPSWCAEFLDAAK